MSVVKYKLIFFVVVVVMGVLIMMTPEVSSSKILVLTFIATPSHKITYMRLVEELAARGHEITIVTPVKASKNVPNITEIFTFDMNKLYDERNTFNVFKAKAGNIDVNPFLLTKEFGEVCEISYDLPRVKNLLKQDFDLVFTQGLFNECVLGMAYLFKAPLIIFFPTSVPDMLANRIGNYLPSSIVSSFFLGYTDQMSFLQRMQNFGKNIYTEIILRFHFEPYMASIYRKKLGRNDIPPVHVIQGNAALIFSNGHFSLNKPKPHFPDVVDVGGIHSRPPKPLPKDLEDFVAGGNHEGFIIFSMGSIMKGTQMPEEKRIMFLKVFSQLKYQVVWKWENDTMAGEEVPKNIKLVKWLPQQDLLGHSKIKMFITHCGGGSTEEAIYHGVPLLGIPMFADQPMNALQAKNHGFLVKLEWSDLNEDTLMVGIQEILNNPKYRENVKKLSAIFKDQENDPLKRGVFWVEYILRHKGAPQLRSAARDLNYFQYHCWDVIAVYFGIVYVIVKLLICVIKFIGRKLVGFSNTNDNVSSKIKLIYSAVNGAVSGDFKEKHQ